MITRPICRRLPGLLALLLLAAAVLPGCCPFKSSTLLITNATAEVLLDLRLYPCLSPLHGDNRLGIPIAPGETRRFHDLPSGCYQIEAQGDLGGSWDHSVILGCLDSKEIKVGRR